MSNAAQPTIIYTLTDEAPLLATYALPADRARLHRAGRHRRRRASDISVAARILAEFPEYLTEEQRVPDNLAELGKLTLAARRQHHQAAQHQRVGAAAARPPSRNCRRKGYNDPRLSRKTRRPTKKRRSARATPRCLGSAVNPVLREGNSDRRAPRGRQALRAQEPALDGRVEPGVAHPRGAHARRRLLPRRKVDDAATGARDVQDGTGHQERQDDRAEAEGRAARRRDHRQHVHEQEGAVRVLRGADGGRAQDRRDVLAARQGDDDEGVAPDRLRPRGARSSTRTPSPSTASCSRSSGVNVNNGLANLYDKIETLPDIEARRDHRATCTPATSTGPSWRWSTRPRASPTCTRRTT